MFLNQIFEVYLYIMVVFILYFYLFFRMTIIISSEILKNRKKQDIKHPDCYSNENLRGGGGGSLKG